MDSRDKIISIAKAELGTQESNGGDDKYIKWYAGWLSLTSAWCAIFVSWVFYMFNKNKYFPKFCDCDKGLQWFIERKRFNKSKAQGGTYIPRPGDVVFFSDESTLKDSTHVGIVTKVANNILHTIEGNSKDMVREKSYALSNSYIIGYGVPEYPDDNPYQKPGGTVKIGTKGEGVMWVQWQLRKAGYAYVMVNGVKKEMKIDGSCGPITDAGIRAYQLDHSLVVDGKVGSKTKASFQAS
jgi:hypothetical protein